MGPLKVALPVRVLLTVIVTVPEPSLTRFIPRSVVPPGCQTTLLLIWMVALTPVGGAPNEPAIPTFERLGVFMARLPAVLDSKVVGPVKSLVVLLTVRYLILPVMSCLRLRPPAPVILPLMVVSPSCELIMVRL